MDQPLLVACLCAQWCGVCRDYAATFEAAAARYAGRARFVQVDIEDDADALGDVEVENFPTLLIARGDAVLFLGTTAPHAATLERLLDAALAGDLEPVALGEHALDLPARVRRIAGLTPSSAGA